MNYTRLTIEEREKIHLQINEGKSNRDIANSLGRSHSTICREVHRFPTRFEYSPSKAHQLATKATLKKGRKSLIETRPELLSDVFQKLLEDYYPEQISKKFKIEHADEPLKWISHETIYKYIYATPKGELKKLMIAHLRSRRKLRKDRSQAHHRRGGIPDATPISERPKEVDARLVPGHWEGDLIIGKNHKSALGTLVERTTRLTILVPVKGKDAKTYDRGLEMAEHRILTEQTGEKVCFADPSSPWQRGTNENTNGLIRQYFPKGTDFNKISLKEIKLAQDRLNNRPMKVLNWATPLEEFKKLSCALNP